MAPIPDPDPEGPRTPHDASFPIIALGASAGGLDSLSRFLDDLPEIAGAAVVVVMHLDPSRQSSLSRLLESHTDLPVVLIEDEMPLTSGRVHVVPPGSVVTLAGGSFRLEDRGETGRHTVDLFLQSIPEERGTDVVAVLLSGTGRDGTLGLRRVKEKGGVTVAQDPSTASYPGMPQSAIDSGVVDLVLPVEKMGREIQRHLVLREREDPGGEASLVRVLDLVRERTGHDFSRYKRNTIARRMTRRRRLAGVADLEEYADRLVTDQEEVDLLVGDLLITVTEFFRDPEAFAELAEIALPSLIDAAAEREGSLRVWVAGCATGEEAYSLAILIREVLEALGLDLPAQIFATDLDPDSIRSARRGVYPTSIEGQVSQARLERFFVREDSMYRVSSTIRDMVIFSVHDVLTDPPFARLDLVSCRNVMIYMSPELQRDVLQRFHFGLREEGALFVGASESAGALGEHFSTLSKRSKIYRRLFSGPDRSLAPRPTSTSRSGDPHPEVLAGKVPGVKPRPAPAALAERALLDAYAPPAVLIDRNNQVIHFLGETGRYLDPPPGAPDLDVTRMAKPPLKQAIHTVIHAARSDAGSDEAPVRSPPVRSGVGAHEDETWVRVAIRPVQHPTTGRGAFLIAFEPVNEYRVQGDSGGEEELDPSGEVIERLQEELQEKTATLNITIQDLETANEELLSANEELLSLNEEFQSTNEQLTASKEELGASNEELMVVNAELVEKVRESREVNADLVNLINNTRIATLFLDVDLRIRRFTPQVPEVVRVIETDLGRPLSDIVSRISLGSEELEERARKSLEGDVGLEEEVEGVEGARYIMRVNPYYVSEGTVNGVVITFVEVTSLRRLEERAETLAESIRTFPMPFILVDEEWWVREWNRGAEITFGYSAEEMVGRSYVDLIPSDRLDEEREWLKGLKEGDSADEWSTERLAKGGRVFPVRHYASRRRRARDEDLFVISDRDVTEWERAERQRETLVRELDHRVKNTLSMVDGILAQTLSTSGGSAQELAHTFRQRLMALAGAHRALVAGGWEQADLQKLVGLILEPLRSDGQITLEGEPIPLPEFVVSPLAMALHELGVNAVRHGALSVPHGRVAVRWSQEEADLVTISWVESGGPEVDEPKHLGFGTRLIREAVPYQVGGSSVLDFRPDGVRCELKIPLTEVTE